MRSLISLIFAAVLVYLGWYVYTHLSQEERSKVMEVGKKGLDTAGDAMTKGTKEVLKHLPSSSSAPAAPAPKR